jgi:hypothetical protein
MKAADAVVRELSALGFDARKATNIGNGPEPIVVVTVQARPEGAQGDQKLNALKDTRRYVEDGTTGEPPTAKPTGDANIDVVIRCLNDSVKPIFTEMNKELGALETADEAFKGSLSAEQLSAKCQIEADKRVQSRAIIAKRRAEITRTLDNFVQTAESRYGAIEHGQEVRRGLEGAVRKNSGRWQVMFDLLDRKAISEFNLYTFLVSQQFKDGKVFFQNSAERQRYHDLLATADDARKSLADFRKQLLDNPNLAARTMNQSNAPLRSTAA